MVDEMTDRNVDKQLVILAIVLIEDKVSTKLLDTPTRNLSTAGDLFMAIDTIFRLVFSNNF